MVAQQILRVSLPLLSLIWAGAAHGQTQARASGEPAIIVDLRLPSPQAQASRATLTSGLRADPRVRLDSGNAGSQPPSPTLEAEQRWRAQNRVPKASDVGALLQKLGVRVALLIMPGNQVHIWALPKNTRFARRVSGAPVSDPGYVAKLVDEWAKAEQGTGPDPTIPLLRESATKSNKKKEKRGTRWWVYVGVGSAVTLASVLILADHFADDRQRIELTLP